MTLKYLDLFSGGGGFALALQGIAEPLLYAERDQYCQQVLSKHMAKGTIPRAPIVADVRQVRKGKWLGHVDMVVAGFPCLGFSTAGKQEGFAHPETRLFFEVIRIVTDLRPGLVLMENVGAIVRQGLQVVNRKLHGLGYNVVWTVLPAYAVGAPHTRNRWFALAWRPGGPALHKLEGLVRRCRPPTARVWREPVARMVQRRDPDHAVRWSVLGNAIVPACARLALCLLVPMTMLPWHAGCPLGRTAPLTSTGAFVSRRAYAAQPIIWPKPDLGLELVGPKRQRINRPDVQTAGLLSRKRVSLWATPRAQCNGASRILTKRVYRDLPTQLRMERRTPPDIKSGWPNVQWVEWLMGYPRGYTTV